MDVNRAITEIDYILGAKENVDKSFAWKHDKIAEVLQQLSDYQSKLGKRNGMFKAVNILTEEAEKEGKL